MKKSIYLLITLIISLFVFSGRVEAAAKELTCVYEDGSWSYVTMLVQTSDGNIHYYVTNMTTVDDISNIDEVSWKTTSDYSDNEVTFKFKSEYYIDGDLTACPKYSTGYQMGDTEVSFSDSKTVSLDYPLIDDLSGNKLPYVVSGESSDDKSAQEEINNNEWGAKCAYTDESGEYVYLYVNKEKGIIYNQRSNVLKSNFPSTSEDYLVKYYNEFASCPSFLYEKFETSSCAMNASNEFSYSFGGTAGSSTSFDGTCNYNERTAQLVIDKDKTEYYDGIVEKPTYKPPTNCGDLLGADLVAKINDIMNIIRIAVPILLIGMGIMDFTKVVFASKEDDMSKAKQKFIRRIIAAIIVFLVPIFVNLVLSIANEVWDYINPSTCIE